MDTNLHMICVFVHDDAFRKTALSFIIIELHSMATKLLNQFTTKNETHTGSIFTFTVAYLLYRMRAQKESLNSSTVCVL